MSCLLCNALHADKFIVVMLVKFMFTEAFYQKLLRMYQQTENLPRSLGYETP